MNAAANMQTMPATGPTLRGLRAMKGGSPISGDAFSALLMQMLGGEGALDMGGLFGQMMGAEENLADLMDSLMQMQGLRRRTDEDDENALALAAEYLAMMGQPMLAAELAEDTASALAAQIGSRPTDTGYLRPMNEALLSGMEERTRAGDGDDMPIVSFEKVLSGAEKADGDTVTAFPAEQMRFSNAIRQARLNMRDANQTEESGEIDIEALQAKVDAGQFASEATRAAEDPLMPDPQEVIAQFRTGIFDNLGKETFVIKLRPEGLGEITVKMTEDKGKIALSIMASDQQVARMLSQEAASLQSALKPLQAEIQEIIMAPESAAAAGGQFAFTGQRFGGDRQFGESHRSDTPGYYRGEQSSEAVEAVASPSVRQDSALDSYI